MDPGVILAGVAAACNPGSLLAVAAGVLIGILVGAVPGLNAPLAIAVAVPLTFTMTPLAAIGMLVGVMKGGGFGGAIAAILLNTPGEPSAAATAFDGHPLARAGKPRKALKMALYSSVFGDSCSDLVLIAFTVPLATLALSMGPIELAALLLLSLTLIASLSGDSLTKGVIATALGALVSSIGIDPETATPRMTFGLIELVDGVPLAAVAIGVLALPELIDQLRNRTGAPDSALIRESSRPADRRVSFLEYWACRVTLLRAAGIGTAIGALPGLGSSLAAFLSYASAKRRSRRPEDFGKGSLEGIASVEAANSAVNGANLIPLLTLGIPGNVSAALLMGAFVIHGVQPGPLIFTRDGPLVYGLFAGMLMANLMVLVIGWLGLRVFVQVVRMPATLVYPMVLLLCLVGVYISTGGMLGVWALAGFGAVGFLMRKLGFSVVCFIIGAVLGPMIELTVRQSVILTAQSPAELLEHPVALLLFALTPVVSWRLLQGRG